MSQYDSDSCGVTVLYEGQKGILCGSPLTTTKAFIPHLINFDRDTALGSIWNLATDEGAVVQGLPECRRYRHCPCHHAALYPASATLRSLQQEQCACKKGQLLARQTNDTSHPKGHAQWPLRLPEATHCQHWIVFCHVRLEFTYTVVSITHLHVQRVLKTKLR